jgi:MOSC domain-containing protein YiiM
MTSNDKTGKLLSIQVGSPQEYGVAGATDPMDRPWTTGFFKHPVPGPVFVRQSNIDGDGQADLEAHGGLDKAVLAYSADHYGLWRAEFVDLDLPFGAFGENLTIAGITEFDVHIGDVWRVGDVLLEVSQPRQPCWKLARRWREHRLPKVVVQTGRSGWYFRVVQEGMIQVGMELTLSERPHPRWSIARANLIMYEGVGRSELAELSAIAQLSKSWLADVG